MAAMVIDAAVVSGLLQTLWNITMAASLTAVELLATALIMAPRAVIRKLAAALRRLERPVSALFPRRSPRHPSPGASLRR
jgi:hypothetical protein